ncbi:MAG: S-layer homology domain-containing protein [Syntrophothermaceae bacterium]|jgi:hypothetical protein
MKRKRKKQKDLAILVSLCFMLTIFMGAVPTTCSAEQNLPTDIKGHWAEDNISTMLGTGVVGGYPDGTFKPNRSITRAEFTTIVNRAFGTFDESADAAFTDVKKSDWYYRQVASGKAAGFISGYPDGTFKPNTAITREQSAVILANLLQLKGEEGTIQFTDAAKISDWANQSVKSVSDAGIVSGYPDGTFKPLQSITRAETVVIVQRALVFSPDITEPEPEKPAEPSFEVSVIADGRAIDGATVNIFEEGKYEVLKAGTTNSQGIYRLELEKGTYNITAIKGKQLGFTDKVIVNDKGQGNAEIKLVDGVEVQGKLLDKNSSPVKNTEITFTTNPTFVSKTDFDGQYKIALLPDKKYTVRAYNFDKKSDGLQIVATDVAVGGKDETIKTLTAPFTIARGGGGGGGSSSGGGPSVPSGYSSEGSTASVINLEAFNYALKQSNIKTINGKNTEIAGNVTVNKPGITLQDMTIKGNFTAGAGINDGDLILVDVIITGTSNFEGGGGDSIHLQGATKLEGQVTISKAGLRLVVIGDKATVIGKLILTQPARIVSQHSAFPGGVEINIGTQVQDGQVTIAAPLGTITVKAALVQIKIDKDITIETITIEADKIKIDNQGTIKEVEVNEGNTATVTGNQPDSIEGEGTVETSGSVSAISITTDPVDVSGLDNDAEVTVTLETTTSGASIYYTTDGTTPTAKSILYDKPFTVTAPGDEGGTVTVKAIGVKSDYTNSEVATKVIEFKAVDLVAIPVELTVSFTLKDEIWLTVLDKSSENLIGGLTEEDFTLKDSSDNTIGFNLTSGEDIGYGGFDKELCILTPTSGEFSGTLTLTFTKTGYQTVSRTFTIEAAEPEVDKTALQAKVAEVADLDEDDYTEESWEVLQDALTAAQAVLANEEATQEEVDEALADLQAAIDDLKKAGEPEAAEVSYTTENEITEISVEGLTYGEGKFTVPVGVTEFTFKDGDKEMKATFVDDQWTIEEVVTEPTTYTLTFTVTDGTDAIVGAEITINEQNLTTDADGKATIILENGTYSYCVTAEGFEAVTDGEVVVSGASVAETVTMTAAVVPQYGITIATVAGGKAAITINPAAEAEAGATVTVTIADIETGKQFKSIIVTDADSGVVATTEVTAGAGYTFIMPAKAVTVTVEVETIPVTTYTVTFGVTGENGSLAATVDSETISSGAEVEAGKTVVFTATPADGYQVKEWTSGGEAVADNKTNTLIVESLLVATAVTVEFEAIPLTPITAIAAISGIPEVGVELTAGALTPAEATVNYQWIICDTADGEYANIAGATASTYTPVAGDGGKYIKIVATGTGSYTGEVISEAVGPVAAATVDVTGASITGTAKVGETLTAVVAPENATNVTYQWQANTGVEGVYEDIAGATNATFIVPEGLVGKKIKIVISGDNSSIATSPATEAVAALFSSITDNSTANDEATLGLVGITVSSGDENVATAEIVEGKIAITSVGAGSATITVKDASENEATIAVTVALDGTITIGEITKYEAPANAANAASVATAKGNIEYATYSMAQANATDVAAVKAAVEAVIAGLELDEVTATVVAGTYTPAVAGTEENVDGTNGIYTFTVSLAKGEGETLAEATTSELIMTIVATAYEATASTDASISGVKAKGVAASVDSEDATIYNVELPYGTVLADLTASDIVVTATDENATVGDAATTDEGATWTVVVTAEDGETTANYTIKVTVAAPPASSDASLTVLAVNPGSITFDAEMLTYSDVEVPHGTESVEVAFTAAEGAATDVTSPATVTITDGAGSFSVTVTAEDGMTTKTYTINFTVAVPVTVTGIEVKTAPDKVTYTEGETLDLTGLVVTLTKSDSTTEAVALADFAAKGITTSPVNEAELATTDTKVTLTHTASGKSVEQVITVNAITSATINPVTGIFDKKAGVQADVTTTITWGDVSSVTAVKNGEAVLTVDTHYTVAENTLTIKKEYLAAQAVGEVALSIEFDKGNAATLTITVSDTTSAPVAPEGDLLDAASGAIFTGVLYKKVDDNIYYNQFDSEGTWGSETLIGTGTEGRMAVDSDGNPHIAYATEGKIGYRMCNGSVWTEEALIESNNGGTCSKPDIAVDSGGYAHMTYTDTKGDSDNYNEIMYATNSTGAFVKTIKYNGEFSDGSGNYYNKGSFIAVDSNDNYFIMSHRSEKRYNESGNYFSVVVTSSINKGGSTESNKTESNFDIYDLTASGGKVAALYKHNDLKTAELTVDDTTISFTNTEILTGGSVSSIATDGTNIVVGGISSGKLQTHYNGTPKTYNDIAVQGTKVSVVNIGGNFYALYTDTSDGIIKSQLIAVPEQTTMPNITTETQTVNTETITVEGTAETNAVITIAGGAGTATGTADGNGNFSIEAALTPDVVNNLSITAQANGKTVSEAATVAITQVMAYTVTYDGNGAEAGDVPTDINEYKLNDAVTVSDNTGGLEQGGYTFVGWNTEVNGQGTNYQAGDIFSITGNTKLYAVWQAKPTVVADKEMQSGDATPAATNGDPAAVLYTVDMSSWFEDEDGDELTYSVVSAVDGDSNDVSGDVQIDGVDITYTPDTAQAGKTVTIVVKANDGMSDSTSNVTIKVVVGAVPPDAIVIEGDLLDVASWSDKDSPSDFIGVLYTREGVIYYNRFNITTNTWEENEEVIGTGTEGKLDIDSTDKPHVVYTTADGEICYKMYNGESWVTTYLESNNNGGPGLCFAPDIAVDSNGHAHITYMDTNGHVEYPDGEKRNDVMYATNKGGEFNKNCIYSGWYLDQGSGFAYSDYCEGRPFIALASGDYCCINVKNQTQEGETKKTYIRINTYYEEYGSWANYEIYDFTGYKYKLVTLYKWGDNNVEILELNVTNNNISSPETTSLFASSVSTVATDGANVVVGGVDNGKLYTYWKGESTLSTTYDDLSVKGEKVSVVNSGGFRGFYALYTDNNNRIKAKKIALP